MAWPAELLSSTYPPRIIGPDLQDRPTSAGAASSAATNSRRVTSELLTSVHRLIASNSCS